MNAMYYSCLLIISVAFVTIVPAGVWLWRLFAVRKLKKRRQASTLVIFECSLFLFAAMFCLRLMESYWVEQDGVGKLLISWEGVGPLAERVLKTVAQSLKAFGVEENIGDYILKGQAVTGQILDELALKLTKFSWLPKDFDSTNLAWLRTAYGVYAATLNVVAPVLGGALIFEVIASIIPALKVWGLRYGFENLRRKYIFSQLNAQSLALATSILNDGKTKLLPVIVFTNTDLQPDEKEQNALLLKAKHIGAICTPEDIATIVKKGWLRKGFRKAEYMLVDPIDVNNVIKYAEMTEQSGKNADKKICKRFRGSSFWVFCQDNAYMLTEMEITDRINKCFKDKVCRSYKGKGGKWYRGWWRPKFLFWKHKLYVLGIMGKNREQIKAVEEDDSLTKLQRWWRKALLCVKSEEKVVITQEDVVWALIDQETPTVHHTRPYMNIVNGMLEKHPLFEPLTDQPRKNTLNIAILGGGGIGTEMLLNSYWCGQLLDVELGINMVSLEKEEDFRRKLDSISEEILLSSVRESELLKVYDDGSEVNDPYCTFRYCEADLLLNAPELVTCAPLSLGANGESKTGERNMKLLDADYFLVALGSDEINITVAERLCRALALQEKEQKRKTKKMVVCVVYDSALHRSMNSNPCSVGEALKRYAVGGIDELYSYDNIIQKANDSRAKEQHESYIEIAKKKQKDEQLSEEKRTVVKNHYNYWSSVANSIHIIYKSFCAFRRYTEGKTVTWEKWNAEVGEKWCYQEDDVRRDLTWLEHRRWNAHQRSIGFSWRGEVKDKEERIRLRIHNCLVESSRYGDDRIKKDRLACFGGEGIKDYDAPALSSGKDAKIVPGFLSSLEQAEKEKVNV